MARTALLEAAQKLCFALAADASPTALLAHFTSWPLPSVHAHGLPWTETDMATQTETQRPAQSEAESEAETEAQTLAKSFVGRTFAGADGVALFFQRVAQSLDLRVLRFDPDDQWVVDPVAMAVCATATVAVAAAGGSGDSGNSGSQTQTVMYRTAMAHDQADHARLKVQELRIWMDTRAAFLACRGQQRLRPQHHPQGRTRKEIDRSKSDSEHVLGRGEQVYSRAV